MVYVFDKKFELIINKVLQPLFDVGFTHLYL